MNFSSCPRKYACARTCAVFVFVFISATISSAQNIPYNGHTAKVDEALVRLKSTDPAALARLSTALPAAVFENLSPTLAIHRVRIRGLNFQAWLSVLARHPDVLYAEPNYVVQVNNTPNDANYPLLWGMSKIGAPSAWNITTGGTSAVVGVVDTGIDYAHPDLAANVWSAPAAFTVTIAGTRITCAAGSHGFNAITKTCDPADDNHHGTHVSGTVGAAGNNSIGVAGVNWTGRIMGLKFLDSTGSGSYGDAISAIEFSVQVKAAFAGTSTPVNVRILSSSWGGSAYSSSLLDEINKANSSDMLFVAAAGNDSLNNDTTPTYPASYSAPSVVSVAATDSGDSLASFSSYGPSSVHLAAPGVSIYSTIPGGSYATSSGTSMATPHVAGAALLVLSACGSLNTAALKNTLLNNVDAVSSLAGKTITGGRLNVYKAVKSCAPVPASIVAYSGAGQTAAGGTAFANPLQARVTDALGNPISGVNVTFTAPSNGASATFGGASSVTTTTNTAGIATSSTLTANSNAGTYGVSASAAGLPPVTFTLTNTTSTGATTIFGWTAPGTYYAGSSAVELGVKFRSDVNGTISGIRFYKGSGDTSTHTGSLWSSTGTLLATGTFSNETTTGWQQLNFSTPVPITANTTYVASYHTGGSFYYSYSYFLNAGVDNPPLHALADGANGPNGVYVYGAGGLFPNQTYGAANYWADVVFATSGPAGSTQTVTAYSGTPQTAAVGTPFASALQAKVTDASANPVAGVAVTFTVPSTGASALFGGMSSVTASTNAAGIATSPIPTANTVPGTYGVTASVAGLASATFTLTNAAASTGATTIFGSMVPSTYYAGSNAVELGLKFRSDVNGTITGIRFYKGSADTSTHTGSLWSSTGALLATGTFSSETANGWQQLNFSTPVAITANTTYVASYHTGGSFYYSYNYFLNAGLDTPPLHALADGASGPNGVYVYGTGGLFPNQTYSATNYWVDVVFAATVPVGPPQTVTAYSGTPQTAVVGTAFGSVLQAKVTDASANPVSGVTVIFTVPASGASASFGGLSSVTASTNAGGIATSPIPTANTVAGAYGVTASVAGLPSATFTLTNAAASTGAATIFGSTVPDTYYAGSNAVELGVKFRSDVNGTITGIRFYKGSGDTSTHTGSLWSSTGALLATGTFSGDTATGWQQFNFSTAVAITANTTYVASYHIGGAFYYSSNYFLNAGVDNPPLHALADGASGPNGVYVYGAGGSFPNQTYAAANYWVDVVFLAQSYQ
jgi:subtilisin family serine protease